MISFTDILKASSGVPVDDFLAQMWGRNLSSSEYQIIEVESTLPLTISANGENLINYRIYGAAGGTGEQTESGEPAGYKLDAVVFGDITENEFPFAEKQTIVWGNGTIESDGRGRFTIRGTIPQGDSNTICLKEPYVIPKSISQGGNYCFYIGNPEIINGLLICFYDANNTLIENWLCSPSWRKSTAYTNMAGKTIAKISFRNGNAGTSQVNAQITPMFSKNTTLTTYIPYRYSTDIPIYIGSTPLEQGEYVDYGEQKVYKYVDGVLTPTDPPVALPAIPTLDGTTIIDFSNSPKPSKMYVKYRRK